MNLTKFRNATQHRAVYCRPTSIRISFFSCLQLTPICVPFFICNTAARRHRPISVKNHRPINRWKNWWNSQKQCTTLCTAHSKPAVSNSTPAVYSDVIEMGTKLHIVGLLTWNLNTSKVNGCCYCDRCSEKYKIQYNAPLNAGSTVRRRCSSTVFVAHTVAPTPKGMAPYPFESMSRSDITETASASAVSDSETTCVDSLSEPSEAYGSGVGLLCRLPFVQVGRTSRIR